jgi:serine/threonine protein phosphatase PrpC
MPSWRNPHCCEWLLAGVVLCVLVAACSTNEQSKSSKAEAERAEKRRDAEGGRGIEANQGAKELKLNVGKCTLIGNFREFNDDAIAVKELAGSTLCLVADGMGGKVDGRVLGQIACEWAFEVLSRELEKNLPGATTSEETRSVIRRAIRAANEAIIAGAAKDPDLRNMGATVVLALRRQGDGIYITGVGNSRAYLVRGDSIEQMTVDHSLAQALVEAKTITANEARTHRFRTVLWKYLGTREVGEGPEVNLVPVQAGDRILLCTDGLHEVVPDGRILGCMHQHADVQKCADALGQLALDSGSRDNVSCIVIEVRPRAPDGAVGRKEQGAEAGQGRRDKVDKGT